MSMKVRDLLPTSNPETVLPQRPAGEVTTNPLRVLAMLAVTVGCAPAAVLAEQPSSARLPELGGVVAAALTEPAPQTGPTHATPQRCPYHFDSDMPGRTFCVYRGAVFGRGGKVCATDVVVIWSSLASRAPVRGGPTAKASTPNREVYLGFVTDPELVVLAVVDPRQRNRAELVGYTLGGADAPQRLAGRMRLPAVHPGSADVLSMDVRDPRHFHIGSCAFASYSGTFLGMIRPRSQMATSVDSFGMPRQ